jgi:hypothetical protein
MTITVSMRPDTPCRTPRPARSMKCGSRWRSRALHVLSVTTTTRRAGGGRGAERDDALALVRDAYGRVRRLVSRNRYAACRGLVAPRAFAAPRSPGSRGWPRWKVSGSRRSLERKR